MRKHSVSRWIVLCFTGAFIFSIAVSSVANYLENRRDVSERADKSAVRFLEMVRVMLEDEDEFREMISAKEKGEEPEIRDALQFLAGVYEVDSLALYQIDPATQKRQMLLSVYPDNGSELGEQKENAPDDVLPGSPLQPVEKQWLAGAITITDPSA